ncbi:DUF4124 domain-containing protein [Hydrogenophaga sp. BPS33]|uniref:DUF4124 domain-containing protein n=1 Tax=Hydrogenophaga sp. BPS33 TaxID=2651974 RepID=UPI00132023DD|nr:DUF4124 domain-containing protein [Hydrogenophaga sp. BPS33]QHE83727.1 DUF4124 domain-containing protein [Hydrogenophaga sp. BPS33]
MSHPMPSLSLPRPPSLLARYGALWLGLGLWGSASHAQIYTCVDASGRRLTSDRPIVACLDREQQVMGGSGTVIKTIPPSYTADERAKLDAQRRQEAEQRARIQEERRRDRALLIRYPNQGVHDKERADALGQVDEVIGAVKKREIALVAQRKDINTELEFYQGDVAKAPNWLKRKVEDNDKQMQIQKRFLEEQAQEKQRINARFDEELVKLKQLWSASGSPSMAR